MTAKKTPARTKQAVGTAPRRATRATTPRKGTDTKKARKGTDTKKAGSGKTVSASMAPRKSKTPKASVDARRGADTYQQLQQDAYCLAERDGFRDDPVCYWLAAEVHLELRTNGPTS